MGAPAWHRQSSDERWMRWGSTRRGPPRCGGPRVGAKVLREVLRYLATTAATTTLGHCGHDLVERGLLIVGEQRLDVVGLLGAELLHLRHHGLHVAVRRVTKLGLLGAI